jgi:hypothetical protein
VRHMLPCIKVDVLSMRAAPGKATWEEGERDRGCTDQYVTESAHITVQSRFY